MGDVVPIEAEKIEGPVHIANGFTIEDAIMVESKDGPRRWLRIPPR